MKLLSRRYCLDYSPQVYVVSVTILVCDFLGIIAMNASVIYRTRTVKINTNWSTILLAVLKSGFGNMFNIF